jgi:hypothetical protein
MSRLNCAGAILEQEKGAAPSGGLRGRIKEARKLEASKSALLKCLETFDHKRSQAVRSALTLPCPSVHTCSH